MAVPTTQPTLHGFPVSPHVRTARLALAERGVAHTFQEVGLDQVQTPAFLAINPFGKMPALTHGELKLYETPAILVYADGLDGTGGSLQPFDLFARARMWQFIGVAQSFLYPDGIMGLWFNRLIAAAMGMTPDEGKAQAGAAATDKHLDVLEAALGGGLLAGGKLSLADLYCGAMVDYVAMTPEGKTMLATRPAVAAWLAKLNERQSFKDTFPAMLRG